MVSKGRRKVWFLLSAMAVTMPTISCQKKRPVECQQGDCLDTYSISDYNGKMFKVKTGKRLFKGETTAADEIKITEGFSLVNAFDAVEKEFDAPFLKGVDVTDLHFYGKENAEYEIQYKFTDTHILVNKIAKKQDIPSQEWTYAETLSDGRLSVTLMGLPIKLKTIERIKDNRGKETQKEKTIAQDSLDSSSHFTVNTNAIKIFETPTKRDLIPASYFKDGEEWAYSKVVVGRSALSGVTLGTQIADGYIQFSKTKNSIIANDVNIAEEQKKLTAEEKVPVLEIPIEWVDYRVKKIGEKASLVEEKVTDGMSGARQWNERDYALVDYVNADRLQKTKTQDNKLKKIEIGHDYLDFVIFESSTGLTIKYSMQKVKDKATSQIQFASDKRFFGLFEDRKATLSSVLHSQESDIEKLKSVQRIYPKNDEIVFYITENTPQDPIYVNAIKKAIDAWDTAFVKSGSKIRVKLGDKRVELGDVRYHKITFYGYEIDSSRNDGTVLLGFGPSVGNSSTGEIFSATTHIYMRAYREGVLRNIRAFIRNDLGLYNDRGLRDIDIVGRMENNILSGNFSVSTPSTGFTSYTEAVESLNKKVEPKNDALAENVHTGSLKDNKCEFANVAASSGNWKKIEKECLASDSKLKDYLDRLRTANQSSDSLVYNVEGEHAAVLDCAQKLMGDMLLSTLVHEIGHNLGLRHNFAASSDGVNYAKDENGKVRFTSSSVMDYPDRDFDVFSEVGPYDIAAIRFSYDRKVEKNDGTMLHVPSGTSIVDAAKNEGLHLNQIKKYKLCIDEESNSNSPYFDPMCRKWDVGSTPQESVNWAISKINAEYILNGYKFNNLAAGNPNGTEYFLHLRRIYEYWRLLLNNKSGLNGNYLENADKKSIEAIVDIERAKGNQTFVNYYEASRLIYEFARDLVFQPSAMCVVELGQMPNQFVELKRLRNYVYTTEKLSIHNCKDGQAYIPGYLAENSKNSSLRTLAVKSVKEVGNLYDDVELTLDPEQLALTLVNFNSAAALDPVYARGIKVIQANALDLLLSHDVWLQVAKNLNFYPGMMDLKDDREEILTLIKDRLINGIDIQSKFKVTGESKFVKSFDETRSLLESIFAKYKALADRSNAPRKIVADSLSLFVTPLSQLGNSRTSAFGLMQKNGYTYKFNNSTYYYDFTGSHSSELLRKLIKLEQAEALQKEIENPDSSNFEKLQSAINEALAKSVESAKPENSEKMVTVIKSNLPVIIASNIIGLQLQNDQLDYLSDLITNTSINAFADGQSFVAPKFASDFTTNVISSLIVELKDEIEFYKNDNDNFKAQVLLLNTSLGIKN